MAWIFTQFFSFLSFNSSFPDGVSLRRFRVVQLLIMIDSLQALVQSGYVWLLHMTLTCIAVIGLDRLRTE